MFTVEYGLHDFQLYTVYSDNTVNYVRTYNLKNIQLLFTAYLTKYVPCLHLFVFALGT
jgi:hypothetical protein